MSLLRAAEWVVKLEAQLTAARAEVEFLRADLAETRLERDEGDAEYLNATDLLQRCEDEIESDSYSDPVTLELVADIAAHLAGRPAATRTPRHGPAHWSSECNDPACPRYDAEIARRAVKP